MDQALRDKLIASVGGGGAHVAPVVALEQLTAAQARRRPSKKLATVWDELAHMVFWQELTLEIVRGGHPQTPEHAAGGWPGIPTGRGATKAWGALRGRFLAGVAELEEAARTRDLEGRVGGDAKSTLGELLLMIANHNSYHLGQIVSLRRLINAWPPPSGGATW
jgi:uncharacterized damage-inducible protein DinB